MNSFFVDNPYALDLQEGIVKRIYFLCRTKKVSVNELAKASGLTPSTIKSILYGHSKNTGVVTLNAICVGFNMTLEEFFRSRLFK
ncbi:MAG: helix-turn-helix transcriptional regulator [Lachnospiraceae bacterium]